MAEEASFVTAESVLCGLPLFLGKFSLSKTGREECMNAAYQKEHEYIAKATGTCTPKPGLEHDAWPWFIFVSNHHIVNLCHIYT